MKPGGRWVALLSGLALCAGCSPHERAAGPVEPRTEALPLPKALPPDEVKRALDAFARWRERWLRGEAVEAELGPVEARRRALQGLMLTEPRRALEEALPAEALAALPEAVRARAERWREGCASLHVLAPRALDRAAADERWLVLDDGEALRLGAAAEGEALGSRARVWFRAVALGGVAAVESLREPGLFECPAQPPALVPAPALESQSQRLGTPKRLLFIRVDFSDVPGEPVSLAAAQNLIDVQASDFLSANSSGEVSLVGTVTPTLRLPRTASYYVYYGGSYTLRQHALTAAAAAGFDFSTYDLDIVGFAPVMSGWLGLGYVGARGVWLNGDFSLSTTVHELGHNFGLHHANHWRSYYGDVVSGGQSIEYGNEFDVMGWGDHHYGAENKRRIGWLPANEQQPITGSGLYRLHALEGPTGSGVRALEVRRDSDTRYVFELRAGGPASAAFGAVANFELDRNPKSQLLDFTTETDREVLDAALSIGRTFSDPVWGIHFTPLAKNGTTPESLDLDVRFGPFAGNQAPVVSLAASATAVAPGAPVTLTATASDPDGDPLAFGWDFDDQAVSTDNQPVQVKSWAAAGQYQVRLWVSDRKGQVTSVSQLITVGAPSTRTLFGQALLGGQPVDEVRVRSEGRVTTTTSDGRYALTGQPAGSLYPEARKLGFYATRSPSFPIPSTGDVTGVDFALTAAPLNSIRGTLWGLGDKSGYVVSDGQRSAVTNDYGDFTIPNVPTGLASLTVTGEGWLFEPSEPQPFAVEPGVTPTQYFRPIGAPLSGRVTSVTTSSWADVNAGPHLGRDLNGVAGNLPWRMDSLPAGRWNLWATGGSSPRKLFAPANFTNPVVVGGRQVGDLNFVDAPSGTAVVHGSVKSGTWPLPGVSVTDGTRTSVTDNGGRFVLYGVPQGQSVTLTPTHPGYTFTPAARTAMADGGTVELGGQDFATTAVNPPPGFVLPATAQRGGPTSAWAVLSALATDDSPESALTYSWTCTSAFPAPDSYTVNDSNGAKSTTVTFGAAGLHHCAVMAIDPGGLVNRSVVRVDVFQEPGQVAVLPAAPVMFTGATRQFRAEVKDQFGNAVAAPVVEWSASGGSITDGGLFRAGDAGTATVVADGGTAAGSTAVTILPPGPPLVAEAAAATPNPVPGTSTALSVLGDDDLGELAITYRWTAESGPAPVALLPGVTSNAAKAGTATFTRAGTYVFRATLTDPLGLTTSSQVQVEVAQTPTVIRVLPVSTAVPPLGTVQFTATLLDQFGQPLAVQPTFAWTAAGGGTIDSSGLFQAGAALGGPWPVTASAQGLTTAAEVRVGEPLDVTAPTISWLRPAADARLSGAVTLELEPADDVGVARVELSLDGAALATVSSPPWTHAVDVGGWRAGPHTLLARAFDAAGNASAPAERPVWAVDVRAPEVRFSSPSGDGRGRGPVAVALEATDDVIVREVVLLADGAEACAWQEAPFTCSVELAPGLHALEAVARDNSGNEGRAGPLAWTVEAPPGCGCQGAAGGAAWALALAAALRLGARRQRRGAHRRDCR